MKYRIALIRVGCDPHEEIYNTKSPQFVNNDYSWKSIKNKYASYLENEVCFCYQLDLIELNLEDNTMNVLEKIHKTNLKKLPRIINPSKNQEND